MRVLAMLLVLGGCGAVEIDAVTCTSCTLDASAGNLDASVPSSMDSGARDASDSARPVESCDGLDNDGNGVIDDLDRAGDGICDCLTLGTLGAHGPWGAGDVLADWLRARSDNGGTALRQPITPEQLARYRVIVVQDLRSYTFTRDELSAIDAWVRAGGGLLTTMGYASSAERTNVNAILAPAGVQYDAAQVLSAGAGTIAITTWYAHPVSAGIRALGVDNGYAVIGAGRVIAEQNGVVVLRAVERGEGRMLVWADDWITYDSEWEDHPEYQVERFWLNAIKWLSPPRDCQVDLPVYL